MLSFSGAVRSGFLERDSVFCVEPTALRFSGAPFFDFGFMAGTAEYRAHLDQSGLWMAWDALAFFVTTAAVIFALIMLDFSPLKHISKISPVLEKQPWFGLVSGLMVLLTSAVLWGIFVEAFKMEVVDYMVRVPVCLLFGSLIMYMMMQTAPYKDTPQSYKGLSQLGIAAILGVVGYYMYGAIADHITGGMASGAPTIICQ